MRPEEWAAIQAALREAQRGQAEVAEVQINRQTVAGARYADELIGAVLGRDGAGEVVPVTNDAGAGLFMLGYSQLGGDDVLGGG